MICTTRAGNFSALGVASDTSAVINDLDLYATYSLPCGFFSQFDARYIDQKNDDGPGGLPGEEMWNLNLFLGYRFPQRRAELRVGVLNLTDEDYHLNPLNLHDEYPHERTFAARFRINF